MRAMQRSPASVVVTVLAGLASTVVLGAQQRGAAPAAQNPAPPPVRVAITVTQVKPDMLGTYQDLIKNEANPGLKKAGLTYRWMFTPVFGQGFTFVSVQPIANFAQYDQPGALQRAIGADGVANYNAKLRPTLVSTQTSIETMNQALSILGGMTAPPVAVVVQTFQIVSGKGADFNAIMTSDYIPAYKKAGVKDFWVYNTNFGGPGGEVITVRPIANFAELDQPGLLNRAGLTAEAIQQLNAKRNAFIASTETEVERLVPDLSFGMPLMQAAQR